MPLPDPGTLAVFAAAAIALLVIPGPAVLYIVTQSIEHGRTAGLVSMLGIQTGGLVHVLAAALGLSALLMRSATAFEIVKFAGAGYLIFLGLRKLFSRERFETTSERPPRRLDRLYRQGIVVNVLNPKTALFFFAFLPQFVASRPGLGRTADRRPRRLLPRPRHHQRRDVRARRRNGVGLAAREPTLPARRALDLRDRARGTGADGRPVRLEPIEITVCL